MGSLYDGPALPYGLDHPQVTLSKVIAGAEQVAQRLRTLSASAGPSSQSTQFYTRIRAKALDSIRGKIIRKQRDLEIPRVDYSFRDITDYVGVRVVTLYDPDLLDAIEYIVELVEAGSQLSEPLFERASVWDSFSEALFIPRTADKSDRDDIYCRFLDKLYSLIEHSCGAEYRDDAYGRCKLEWRRSNRYSSAHLIFNAVSYHQEFSLKIPVEFQLRAATEDIWSEISHKLVYKSRDSHLWSVEYAARYSSAETASETLKESVDHLPILIRNFHQSADAATSNLKDFWTRDRTAANTLGLDLHFSYGVTLFFFICDFAVEDTARAMLLNETPYRIFKTYKDQIERYRTTSDPEIASNILAECVGLVRKVIDFLDSTAALPSGNFWREADKELVRQRRQLCNLEILRLESLISLFHGHQLVGSKIEPLSEEGSPDNEPVYAALYSRFCQVIDDRELQIRPICVIHYWKYLLALRFKDQGLARKNIVSALELVDVDNTIPPWSIYRVLVPRMMATVLHNEARNYKESFNVEQIRHMGSLRSEIQMKLEDALKYALDSFRMHRVEHQNRGDVRFGFEPNDAILAAQLVVDITLLFHEISGRFIAQRQPTNVDSINDVLDHLQQENLNEIVQDSGARNLFLQRIKSVQAFVEFERMQKRSKSEAPNG